MQANEKPVAEGVGAPAPREGSRASGARLNDQAKKRLGLHLRAMYGELVSQPVPDRFRDLIERLDQATDRPAPGN